MKVSFGPGFQNIKLNSLEFSHFNTPGAARDRRDSGRRRCLEALNGSWLNGSPKGH